jgi:hypothetical protein
MSTKFWFESLKGQDHLEDLCVDRRILDNRILRKYVALPWYAFDGRVGGPQNQSGHGGGIKNMWPLSGIESSIFIDG